MARSKKSYPQGMTLQVVPPTSCERRIERTQLREHAEDAAKVVRDLFDFDHLDREQFVALALNTKNRVIGAWAVSVRKPERLNRPHPRNCSSRVMLSAASIVHRPQPRAATRLPSGADIQLTRASSRRRRSRHRTP